MAKILDFLGNIIFGDKKNNKVPITCASMDILGEIYIRELAFNLLVNKIANAISKCQMNIYTDKKRDRNEEWYRWNVSPNPNQSAPAFWAKLIYQLYDNNEALIIPISGNLYVADSFIVNKQYAFYDYRFESIQIDDFSLSRAFRQNEVFYFQLNNKKMVTYLNGTMTLYTGLIKAAYSSYMASNGNKGFLKISQFAEQEDDFQEYFNQLVNEDFKKFFESSNAVMPLYEGYEYESLGNTGTQTNTRDIKSLIDDVIQTTANAFNMPTSIAIGNVQDTSKAIDEFLTFCIDPLIRILEAEITRKSFTQSQVINGSYVKFDTTAIKHIDLLDVATAIDKLISSGCFTINDIRKTIGADEIDEPWANQFFMTKNYSTIEDLMNQLNNTTDTKGVMQHEEILSACEQCRFRRGGTDGLW